MNYNGFIVLISYTIEVVRKTISQDKTVVVLSWSLEGDVM